MNEILPLIALITGEIALIFVGIALVPILNEIKNKKFIKYAFPIFGLVGFMELCIYVLYLIK